jgi:hypothetical protein
MSVKYCNAICQKKHWAQHKRDCKIQAAELRDKALFKDPPPTTEGGLSHLLPTNAIIVDIVCLASTCNYIVCTNLGLCALEQYYPCCGKFFCGGCVYSFQQSGNMNCPFCNSDRHSKTYEDNNEDLMKQVEVNDAGAMNVLGTYYYDREQGLQQDHAKAMQLMVKAAELGDSNAHNRAGMLKKARFHYEDAAIMAGHEVARNNLGCLEGKGETLTKVSSI